MTINLNCTAFVLMMYLGIYGRFTFPDADSYLNNLRDGLFPPVSGAKVDIHGVTAGANNPTDTTFPFLSLISLNVSVW